MSATNPQHRRLLTAVTTGSEVLSQAELVYQREHTFYIVGSAGVASGAVQIETAPYDDYAGTWAPLGSAVTVVASAAAIVQVTGALNAVRARVSTTIGSGTVTVDYYGN